MKRIALAALAMGLMTTGSHSANIEFRGGVCLTAITPACAAIGWNVGNCADFRYNPRNLGDNGPSTRFSIFAGLFAENYTLASGNIVGTFKTVQGTGVGRGAFTFTSTMRFSTQTPSPLEATSDSVSLAGNVRDFDGEADCDVSFRASGTRVP